MLLFKCVPEEASFSFTDLDLCFPAPPCGPPIYIYIYIYTRCEVIIWAKFGHFRCYYVGQVGVIIWAKLFLAYKNSGFKRFLLYRSRPDHNQIRRG